MGLEEIVADDAGGWKPKAFFPRERPIVEIRDVVFLDVSEGSFYCAARSKVDVGESAAPAMQWGLHRLVERLQSLRRVSAK